MGDGTDLGASSPDDIPRSTDVKQKRPAGKRAERLGAEDHKAIVETTLSALERLLAMFAIERYIYLGITVASFLLLLYAAFSAVVSHQADTKILVSFFGSSGLFAVASVRVTWFFNQAFTLVSGLVKRMSP